MRSGRSVTAAELQLRHRVPVPRLGHKREDPTGGRLQPARYSAPGASPDRTGVTGYLNRDRACSVELQ